VVVITYLLGRRWKSANYVSWPVAFGAMSQVPPATGISFSSWWIVNLIFNGVLRRRKPAWWSKYSIFIVSPSLLLLLLIVHRLCFIRRARLRCCSRDGNHLLLYNPPSRFVELVGKYCVENHSRRQRHALHGLTSAWILWPPEGNLGVIKNA
jgi:OPT oligopeptide transporter protein.